MSVILTNPVYVCDLCGRKNLVYHSAYASDGNKVWGVGFKHEYGRMDNFDKCFKHICMYCLDGLRHIVHSLEDRNYFV